MRAGKKAPFGIEHRVQGGCLSNPPGVLIAHREDKAREKQKGQGYQAMLWIS
jgi:hypothetical protein